MNKFLFSNFLRKFQLPSLLVLCIFFLLFSSLLLTMKYPSTVWEKLSTKTSFVIHSGFMQDLLNSTSIMKQHLCKEKFSEVLSHIDPPSKLPYNVTNTGTDYFIRNILIKHLSNEKPGFFVEAGALDGQLYSNTLWLELMRNWTGLLIEPNPISYHHLRTRHRKTWSSNTCISDSNNSASLTLEVPHIPKESKLNWLFLSNSRVIHSPFHTYNDIIRKHAEFSNVTVQCYPLHYYLQALNVTTVDFLSLDIQGGEKKVLLSFPHDKIRIKLIVVEYYNFAEDKNNPKKIDRNFIDEMRQRGFVLIGVNKISFDYFFKNILN